MPAESGQMLSHYRLVEKIGEGGMGVVWKAEDSILGRTVAIKVLPADVSRDDERRKMFLEEARLASSVSEAHIVQVFEFGREGSLDFIVMEYVDGKPLDQFLLGRPLPSEKLARIGLQIAQALSRTHRKGLVHRDLKPGNVMITSEGEVKVVDFGLATLLRGRDPAPPTNVMTRAPGEDPVVGEDDSDRNPLAGTIPYMSPEQAVGDKVDSRSDIFSLGTILYEMTSGQRPFAGRTLADQLAEIRKARAVPIHELVPTVPLDLERIIHKALAARPADRYQTMEDLAVDLKRLGRDLETGSSPSFQDLGKPSRPEPARWMRWVFPAAALAIVGIGLGAWLVGRFAGGYVDPNNILIVPMQVRGQTEGAGYVGLAFAEAIAVNLAQSEGLKVLPVPESVEPGGGNIPVAEAARKAGAGRFLSGSITRIGDRVQASLSLVDTRENRIVWGTQVEADENNLTELAARLARQVAAEMGAPAPRQYDSTFNLTGSPEMAASPATSDALGSLKRNEVAGSLAATEELIQEFPTEPDAHVLRAKALLLRLEDLQTPEARKALEKSLAILKQVDPASPYPDIFLARVSFLGGGNPELDENRDLPLLPGGTPGAAIDLLTRVLDRGDLTPAARVEILNIRAWPKRNLGDTEGAISDLETALELDPTNATSLADLGSFLHETGRQEEALVRTRQSVALEPSNWIYHHHLSRALKGMKRFEEATRAAEKACNLGRGQQPCASLAILLHLEGRSMEAANAVRQAESLPETVAGVYNVACYHALTGDRKRSLEYLERTLRLGGGAIWMSQDPDLASLHGDPEFEDLVDKMRKRLDSGEKSATRKY